jgi:hypothetical protein
MIRLLVTFIAASVVASPAIAQEQRLLTATEYSVAIPLGDTPTYGPGSSWTGAAYEARWMSHPHTSIGALIGFNEFHRRESGTFDFPSGAVTGDQYRDLIVIPLLVTGAWYLNSNPDDPRWYIGAGGGLQYTDQFFQIGLDQRHQRDWNAVIVPEVGLTFSAWYATGGIVSLRYHLPSESSAFLGSTQRRFPYLSLSLGFGYR